jgi:predicted hotdog family 3-hydroxylacyl-ACP dehydratase
MSKFDREQILRMIPHAGSMCLLDAVLDWDETSIRCESRRYRDKNNPMRRPDGELGTACGVELAAQALAVHCRLLAESDGPPQQGFLVSLRDTELYTRRLDEIAGDLVVNADRLAGDAISATYRFVLAVNGFKLLSGRATVLLAAEQKGLGSTPLLQSKAALPAHGRCE